MRLAAGRADRKHYGLRTAGQRNRNYRVYLQHARDLVGGGSSILQVCNNTANRQTDRLKGAGKRDRRERAINDRRIGKARFLSYTHDWFLQRTKPRRFGSPT